MPIISISRGTLSGGRAVAACLSARLGYPCIDREVLQEAGRSLGAPVAAVEQGFETAPGLWERLGRKREKYILAVRAALADACLEGSLVYHGQAGQFLLQGLRGVLRVRLIAPPEFRIRAIMGSRRGFSRRDAAEYIANADLERKRRVRMLYGADVEDPSLYDLTVNLRSMSTESACIAVAGMAVRPEFEVTAEVKAELEAFAAEAHRRLAAALPGGD